MIPPEERPEKPGSVVGWIEDGALVRTRAIGFASGAGLPLTATTGFDAASLSKPVFARWAIELGRRGELDLEAPIELDPGAVGAAPDPRLRQITPATVLTHSSGFPNWREAGQPLRLLADPGERIVYSGEGLEYLLAALRLERGEGWVEDELEGLLARLGMGESSFVRVRGEEAVGHRTDGKCEPPPPRRPARAAGSLHTSLRDYTRFLAASLWPPRDDEVGAEVRRLMTTVRLRRGEDARTIGWAETATAAGSLLWQHGDNPGFKHLVAVRPRARAGVVALTNSDGGIALVRELAAAAGIPRRHWEGYRSG